MLNERMASNQNSDTTSVSLPSVPDSFKDPKGAHIHQNQKKKKKKKTYRNKSQTFHKNGTHDEIQAEKVTPREKKDGDKIAASNVEKLQNSHVNAFDDGTVRRLRDTGRVNKGKNGVGAEVSSVQIKKKGEVIEDNRNRHILDAYLSNDENSGEIRQKNISNHVHSEKVKIEDKNSVNRHIPDTYVSNDQYVANRSSMPENCRLGNGYTLPPNIPMLSNDWNNNKNLQHDTFSPIRKSLPIMFDDYRNDHSNAELTRGFEQQYDTTGENKFNYNDTTNQNHFNYSPISQANYQPKHHSHPTLDVNSSTKKSHTNQKTTLDSPLQYENYQYEFPPNDAPFMPENFDAYKIKSNNSPNYQNNQFSTPPDKNIYDNPNSNLPNKHYNVHQSSITNKNTYNNNSSSNAPPNKFHNNNPTSNPPPARFNSKELDNFTTPKLPSPKHYAISPRKQAFMRYKKSNEQLNHNLNEVKNNLKNNHIKDNLISNPREELDLDEKVTLFKYKSAKILVYDDKGLDKNSKSSGRLLSHGEFEIFQLHNGDVTYLSCGQTFVYPLLPKVRILRINFNQFILPLQYPERYWKIFINSDEPHVMDVCENTFTRSVQYSNLYNNESSKEVAGDESNLLPDFTISTELPPSPPSAPISPHNNVMLLDFADQNERNLLLSDLNKYPIRQIQQPKPKHIVHTRMKSSKSDSSMDSLLDEYEENITFSKAQSRMHSRRPSISSRVQIEDFPSTSLSEYNRSHKNKSYQNPYKNHNITPNVKNSVRSRRSSRSELYVAETGWMEPSVLPKTKSTYSMASCPNPELNNTYKNIYKSITQRNLRQYNDDELSVKSQRIPPNPKIQTHYARNSQMNRQFPTANLPKVKLDSTEIFQLISANKPASKPPPAPSTPKGFTSRLFGW